MEDVKTRRRVSFLCRLNLVWYPIVKRVGINTTKFVKTRTRFNSDGFASVALVDAV